LLALAVDAGAFPADDRSKGVAKYEARDFSGLEGSGAVEFKALEVTDASE